jgi:ElaB/YqjD/DUF883 family membrane-anchored ribosome-binding protein
MSYPMNEFVTDLEVPVKKAGKLISSAVENAFHDAEAGVDAGVKKGRQLYESVHNRVGRNVEAANHALQKNPYPVALVAIGAGFAMGYLFSILIHHTPRN